MKEDKKYEPNTKFSEWYYQKESFKGATIYSIRRVLTLPDGKTKLERHPADKYKAIRTDEKKVSDYVIRLNGRDPRAERIKEKLEFNHAFIDDELLEEFESVYLRNYIPNEEEARQLTAYLKKYALSFFIGKLGQGNPIEWHRNQHLWGLALLNKTKDPNHILFEDGNLRSANVLKRIVFELNRFMVFLHTKKPDIPALVFAPLTPAVLKEHEARREMNGDIKEAKYVKPEHWAIIEHKLPDGWGDVIKLCYLYGLRRCEAYGLSPENIKNGFLSVEKQLDKIVDGERTFKPLKGRYKRKTPHWNIKPQEVYKLIQKVSSLRIHADTITDNFATLCADLEVPRYTVHDLRRTFITNCVQKGIPQEELRLAVGHVDGATTYKYYVMDARNMDDDVFIPV